MNNRTHSILVMFLFSISFLLSMSYFAVTVVFKIPYTPGGIWYMVFTVLPIITSLYGIFITLVHLTIYPEKESADDTPEISG